MSRAFGSLLIAAAAAVVTQPSPAPVHTDPAAVERGMLDATKGLMFGDFASAREALDRVESGCRRIGYDDTPAWPRAMVDQDVAMHAALSRAREFTARHVWEDASNSMIWVERCCRDCHALRATSANPSDSESPIPKTSPKP